MTPRGPSPRAMRSPLAPLPLVVASCRSAWVAHAARRRGAIAAEKLRAQGSVAGMIQVYIRTNPHKEDYPQYSKGLTIPLPEPSGDTLYLTRAALWGLRRIYRPGFAYQKAGIVLMNLSDATNQQASLFCTHRGNDRLMEVIDRANAIWGRGTLRSAATGVSKSWVMKREKMSPQYTTHWDQLPIAI